MDNRKGTINKTTVDELPKAPKGDEIRLWDDKLSGFHVRVYPTGRKVYALRYRPGVGQPQRVLTIGKHDPLTPAKAREAATIALGQAAEGKDPALEKAAGRHALTVTQLIERYLTDGPATKPAKRAISWTTDSSNLKRHLEPLVGRKIANTLTKAEAARAIRDITIGKTAADVKSERKRGRAIVKGGEGIARRTKTVAVAMWNWGLDHGHVRGGNPFDSVKLAAPKLTERFLTNEELAGLLEALVALEC